MWFWFVFAALFLVSPVVAWTFFVITLGGAMVYGFVSSP